jgi:hypothetical protein
VRLLIEKEQWIKRRRGVRGYRARVTVIKNKLAPAGKSAAIEITFLEDLHYGLMLAGLMDDPEVQQSWARGEVLATQSNSVRFLL